MHSHTIVKPKTPIRRQSTVVDDLTHNLTTSLRKDELNSYLEECNVAFPLPILHTLGRKCVLWVSSSYILQR